MISHLEPLDNSLPTSGRSNVSVVPYHLCVHLTLLVRLCQVSWFQLVFTCLSECFHYGSFTVQLCLTIPVRVYELAASHNFVESADHGHIEFMIRYWTFLEPLNLIASE